MDCAIDTNNCWMVVCSFEFCWFSHTHTHTHTLASNLEYEIQKHHNFLPWGWKIALLRQIANMLFAASIYLYVYIHDFSCFIFECKCFRRHRLECYHESDRNHKKTLTHINCIIPSFGHSLFSLSVLHWFWMIYLK